MTTPAVAGPSTTWRSFLRPVLRLLVLAVLTATACPALAAPGAAAPHAPSPRDGDPLFREAVFASTHNSYSGGDRGDLRSQLDLQVRQLELDVHLVHGQFQVGDDAPGDAVYHGGDNPKTNALTDWLLVVKKWSDRNRDAAPITLVIATHSNLNTEQGSSSILVDDLTTVFGPSRLAQPKPGDTVDDLRGKIIPVLSGRVESRLAYLRDRGVDPAVTINDSGQVVEVHDSGHGTLWYWTGQVQSDWTVKWLAHARYDTGRNPVVALTDSGILVEVHQSAHRSSLWYRLGYVDVSGRLKWHLPSTPFMAGQLPSLRVTGPKTVSEIHMDPANPDLYIESTARVSLGEVTWSAGTMTNIPGYSTTWASNDKGQTIEVESNYFPSGMTQTLQYSLNPFFHDSWHRIIYPQIMAVDVEYDDRQDREAYQTLLWNTTFAAITADRGVPQTTWMNDVRESAMLRVARFAEDSTGLPIPNYPSTDTPFAKWYQTYLHNRSSYSY
ncbi:hypothetical protein AB0H43_28175 [Hamadaea sp. NPDC050747]|uniref:hypothetical protein n=1 Tax=Hamadaea sp. NPDC050747 TaxID=3155789 RepID=UPI0033BFF649